MNSERFTQLLKDPEALKALNYSDLKQVTLDFPYCQNLRLLLLRKSQLEQNEELNQNIQSAAAYSNNRSHLYRSFKADGGQKEKLDAYQLAETFLEENKNKPNLETKEEYNSIPTESSNSYDPNAPETFDLSNSNEENKPNDIKTSKLRHMKEDDSMEFDLNEHLKKFREEKLEPEVVREESPLKEKGKSTFFLEDLIEASKTKKTEVPENSEPSADEEEIDTPVTAPPAEAIEELPVEEIAEIPPHSINIPVEELPEQEATETDASAGSGHEYTEILSDNEEEEEEIIVPDLSIDYNTESTSTDNVPLVPEPEKPSAAEHVIVTPPDIPLEIINTLEKEETEEVQTEDNDTIVVKPVPKNSFSSWLKQFESPEEPIRKKVIFKEAEETEVPQKQQAPTPSRIQEEDLDKKISLDDLIKAKKSKSDKKKKKASNEAKKSKKGGKKSKKNKKQEKIIDFAAQSLNENEEIASETLAQILGRQGAYDKAIRIYERLKLIYPEKSVFFASAIEKLKIEKLK